MTDHSNHALVSEEDISRLVEHFYELIRADPELGPIFNAKIDDWAPHLATMCDFWSSVMLTTGRFKGQPMPKHIALAEFVEPRHFDIWLALFRRAANDVCAPEIASAFVSRAERIAASLQAGMYGFANPATST